MADLKQLLSEKYNKPILSGPLMSFWEASNTVISLSPAENRFSKYDDNEHEIGLLYIDKSYFINRMKVSSIKEWARKEEAKKRL